MPRDADVIKKERVNNMNNYTSDICVTLFPTFKQKKKTNDVRKNNKQDKTH